MTGRRVVEVVRQEINGVRPIVQMGLMISRLLPDLVGNRLRTSLLRACGLSIGAGTVVGGGLSVAGTGRVQDRLRIGARCFINAGCFFDASAGVRVGDDVAMGQQVMILTQSHVIGPPTRRADALTQSSVTIENGCWIGARVVVLPGVTIGAGAVVAAGAVVRTDVPACAVVAGVPARIVRMLE